MEVIPEINTFVDLIQKSVEEGTFVKLTLSKVTERELGLKNVYIRLIELKGTAHLSFQSRYDTRDEVKNHTVNDALDILRLWLGERFLNADLLSTTGDHTLLFNRKRRVRLLHKKASTQVVPPRIHDRDKQRTIKSEGNHYLQALGITNTEGKVVKSGQRKFKQINKYIEIVNNYIQDTFSKKTLNVLDVGSGKGYLTFALYDYLKNTLNKSPQIAGIELRQNLVDFTNALARECKFEGLQFVAKDINDFEVKDLDVLIALHACDIATDIAIAKGIQSKAELIIVAPCCHKQIRKAMQPKSELTPVLEHGILLERQAELITDGIRALLLEAHGYKTKVFEFISTEHTSKNLMIVGTKDRVNPDALQQIDAIKSAYGIESHYLETLMQ